MSVITLNDNVHGCISLPNLCKKIIDTPEFQRLRNLKQLGLGYWVYPSASHNRFEHCIGTAYLAKKYVSALSVRQMGLDITENDILCVQIAGLCHDLGHGPFSHTWELFTERRNAKFVHEEMSVKLFRQIYSNLQEDFTVNGINASDVNFIEELILGKPGKTWDPELHERNTRKYFLYQIISNDDTGIDVDKFDYLLRDCLQLNLRVTFDYQRVMDNSFVVQAPCDAKKFVIAYRKKVVDNIEDLFSGRFRMHQAAYQHRVNKIIEQMTVDALDKADQSTQLRVQDGRRSMIFRMSSAHKNLLAFTGLSDSIIDMIKYENKSATEESRKLIDAIRKRDLYFCFGYINGNLTPEQKRELKEIHQDLISLDKNVTDGKKRNSSGETIILVYEKEGRNLREHKLAQQRSETKSYIVLKKTVSSSSDLQASLRPRINQLFTSLLQE